MTKQAKYRIRVKKALLGSGQSITGLAKTIGYSRENVSRCINKGGFPRIRRAINKEVLGQ